MKNVFSKGNNKLSIEWEKIFANYSIVLKLFILIHKIHEELNSTDKTKKLWLKIGQST